MDSFPLGESLGTPWMDSVTSPSQKHINRVSECHVFCIERCVCYIALQSLLQTLWWREAPLCVLKPTRHTTSPADPTEPSLLQRSPGTEMEKSWRQPFTPRYMQGASSRHHPPAPQYSPPMMLFARDLQAKTFQIQSTSSLSFSSMVFQSPALFLISFAQMALCSPPPIFTHASPLRLPPPPPFDSH